MTTWFISRHPGAIEWIQSSGVKIDKFKEHLSIEEISDGDVVIGVLPLTLVAEVCAKGARFLGMEFTQTRESRGTELSSDTLNALDCRLQEFFVKRL